MTSMDTPLLVSDGDYVTPSLSSGPAIVSEESEFSRLIAQCSSSSVLLNDHFEVDQTRGIMMDGRRYYHNGIQQKQHQQTDNIIYFPRGPWITALTGTLSFVHLFLIWTSCYMPTISTLSMAWTSCHLHISINWQHDFLPFLDDFTDTVIGTTNLRSLLQELYTSRQFLLVFALCIVSILLPCAFIIVSPILVVTDYKHAVNVLQRSRHSWTSARNMFEVSIRWSWMTGFVLILLSMSTSFLELHWTDTRILVGTRFNNPLAAYMLGITAAVGLVVLLRTPTTQDDKTRLACNYPAGDSTMMASMIHSPQQKMMVSRHHHGGGDFQMLRTPPPHAFQHLSSFPPMQLPQNNENDNDDDDEPTMTVLEEELSSPTPITTSEAVAPATDSSALENNARVQQQQQQPAHPQHPLPPSYSGSNNSPPTPDLVSEESFVQGIMEDTTRTACCNANEVVDLTFWHKFTAFQLGLLSIVLWIPALYLPMLIVSYSGVAREFLQSSSLRIFVWQVPSTTWQQGQQLLFSSSETTTTPVWILIVLVTLLFVTMLVLPVLATCLGILTWLGEGKWSTISQAWLYTIHPALGGIVFSVALMATVHALTPLGEFVLNQDTWGICNELEKLSGETCLAVHARLLPGAWFYLTQSLVLEGFVMVTLRWC